MINEKGNFSTGCDRYLLENFGNLPNIILNRVNVCVNRTRKIEKITGSNQLW